MDDKKILEFTLNLFNIHPAHIVSLPESFSSLVYLLEFREGENLVLKIPFNRRKFLREVSVLTMLQGKLPVPEIIDIAESEGDFEGALLLSHIPGLPASRLDIGNLAFKSGELLAKFHTNALSVYGDYDLTGFENGKHPDWWFYIKRIFEDWIPECSRVLTKEKIHECTHVFHEMFEQLPPPDGPCLIHGDYRPGNLILEENEIRGVIDFESARGGSSDWDFTKMKIYVWDNFPGTREDFLKGYEVIRPIPPIDKTLPFFQFFNAFGGVAWFVRRGETDRKFLDENLQQLNLFLR